MVSFLEKLKKGMGTGEIAEEPTIEPDPEIEEPEPEIQAQEKIIEKKNAELNDKTKKLLQDSKINQIKKKYKDLVKRKKAGTLNWMDEEKLEIYKDAIELEKKKD